MNPIKFSLHLIYTSAILFVCCIVLNSCGNENNAGSEKKKTDSVEYVMKGSNTKDTSENFIINYDVTGKRTGKMDVYRSMGKFKEELDYETNGVRSFNQLFLINDTVFTVTRISGKKVGARSGYRNFKETYLGNELLIGIKDFNKYLDTARILGNEKIIGYDCEIFELSDRSLVSVYNRRYALKVTKPLYIATARSLMINPVISQNIFDLPEDIEFHDKDKRMIRFGTKEDSIAYYNKKKE